jgi:NAD(P)-dependent dehydrogenase (short-subunit alcohol dehydrogenase family)
VSEKKVAIVTGAGQGLGRVIAEVLNDAGFTVASIGRTLAKVERTAAELGGSSIAVAADLTDPVQVRRAFETVATRLGGIDVLVNCAGEWDPFPFPEAGDDEITNMIAQCLTSPMFCMREAIKAMRIRGAGDIVNISTQSAIMPQPFMTVYGAAKAGLEAVSQGLRYELKGEDIRIFVCQIGAVARSDVSAKVGLVKYRERIQKSWAKTGISGMYTNPGSAPETIAAAVLHALLSPRDTYIEAITLRGMGIIDAGA